MEGSSSSVSNSGNKFNKGSPATVDMQQDTEYLEKTSVNSYVPPSGMHSRWTNFKDSFKRVEHEEVVIDDIESNSKEGHDGKHKSLKQNIKKRHIIAMGLATGLGTGGLVGSGQVLAKSGPGALVIGYAIVASMVYCMIQAACELALPYTSLSGGFNSCPSFLVDPGFNFAIAWIYALQWLCVLPLELVTASLTIKYWTTSVNPDAFVVIFYVIIVVVNFFGASGYAEAEFFFNSCKVLMLIGFFICGIVVNAGGAGDHEYIGAKYWHNPGAFNHGFKGVCYVFTTAAFSFGASEFIALTAAEQSHPRRSLTAARKQMLVRIFAIFLAPFILVGFLVPYNSDRLLGANGPKTAASPFVIAISSHGVKVAPHFINAVILLAVLSVANSAFYSSSRLLLSLSEQNFAPKIFKYVDRKGRPLPAMVVSAIFGLLSFVAADKNEAIVFNWLLSISGLSQLFTWAAILLSHIRFRDAMRAQNKSLNELAYVAQTGYWGSWYAFILNIFILCVCFWVSLSPPGSDGKVDANNFFQNYLAAPLCIVFYVGYKVWKRDWRLLIPASEIDLVSHRKIFDAEVLKQEDLEFDEQMKHANFGTRMFNLWC